MTTGTSMWTCPNCGLTMYQAYMTMHMNACNLASHAMTPAEFAEEMASIAIYGGEGPHIEADELLCKVLRQHGYNDGVETYEGMDKWYA